MTFGAVHDIILVQLASHQIRYLATHKVGCQPADCSWPKVSFSVVGVGTYSLMYSLLPPLRMGKPRPDVIKQQTIYYLKVGVGQAFCSRES